MSYSQSSEPAFDDYIPDYLLSPEYSQSPRNHEVPPLLLSNNLGVGGGVLSHPATLWSKNPHTPVSSEKAYDSEFLSVA